MTDKKELREYMKKVRKSLSLARIISYSNQIMNSLREQDCYREADVILSYISFSSEVDTKFLMRQALADGKRIAAPRCSEEKHKMDFYYFDDADDLAVGHYGILEPTGNNLVNPEDGKNYLLLLPGLAFDEKRNRLGYGGGYYDCYLKEHPGLKTVMLAYELEKVDAIDTDSFDVPADMVITEVNRYC